MENKEQKGQILKQAREAKGLSLQAVHAATKIPMDILRALEEGYTVRTLTPFYYRGFVKIYAQYLGIDLNSILGDYHPEQLPAVSKTPKQNTFEIQNRLMRKQEKIQGMVKVIVVLLAFFILIKMLGFIIHKIKNRSARTTQVNAVPTREDKPKRELVPVPKAAVVPVTPVVAASVSGGKEDQRSGKKINLTVRAPKNSWLRVRADNTTVFQSTLNKGGVETWTATDEIEISGRNLNQLEFEFNGKIIGPLGRENREVRKVVFTKDGLSVQK